MPRTIYQLTPEEGRLIEIVRNIKYGTIQEITVRDGKLKLCKVATPPEVFGIAVVESITLEA